ncbi:hypothetical protein C8F01DRAFT_99221 [Mycena amicta]|nr:hypothetical protein C8F01DRAFT_99221 [Mycena amicta]
MANDERAGGSSPSRLCHASSTSTATKTTTRRTETAHSAARARRHTYIYQPPHDWVTAQPVDGLYDGRERHGLLLQCRRQEGGQASFIRYPRKGHLFPRRRFVPTLRPCHPFPSNCSGPHRQIDNIHPRPSSDIPRPTIQASLAIPPSRYSLSGPDLVGAVQSSERRAPRDGGRERGMDRKRRLGRGRPYPLALLHKPLVWAIGHCRRYALATGAVPEKTSLPSPRGLHLLEQSA